ELTLARRRSVHAALAAAVRHYRPTAVTTIAHHLDQADDPQARTWLLRAARQAASLHANQEADRAYAAWLGRPSWEPSEGPTPAEVMVERATVQLRQGRYQSVTHDLVALAHQLDPAEATWQDAVQRRAEAFGRLARPDEGIALLQQ